MTNDKPIKNSIEETLTILFTFIKVNRFDRHMIESLYSQITNGYELTEKQIVHIEKLKFKYRKQLENFERGK